MKATKVFGKKVIGIVVVTLFMLAGCGNKGQEACDTAMEKGIQSVVSEEYAKAEVSFELALESNKEDKKATLYLNQVQNYVQAKAEFEKKDYSGAQKTLEKVLKSKDGLKEILKAADKLNQEIEAIQKEVSANDEKLAEVTQLSEAQSYQESNGILDQLLKQDLGQMGNDFKEKCEELKQKNGTALEEIIQQEKEVKEAAEAIIEDTPKEETFTPVIEESKSPAVDDIAVKKQHITDKFFAENPDYVGMTLKIEPTNEGEDSWFIYANDSANGHTYWQGKYFTSHDTILGGSIGGDY